MIARFLWIYFIYGAVSVVAQADTISIAVASNFTTPMQALIVEFEQHSKHKIQAAYGSTGKFYAQIQHGAPFQILLAADQTTPQKLAQQQLALASTQFTYATGRLVLWSADIDGVDANGERLRRADFKFLGIADPKVAPYGVAAIEVLKKLQLEDALRSRFVQGESIAQTMQFVASGNAELGFVALSQVWQDGKFRSGSGWVVPRELHTPLRHDAIVLQSANDKKSANEFMLFLRSEPARAIIKSFGYE